MVSRMCCMDKWKNKLQNQSSKNKSHVCYCNRFNILRPTSDAPSFENTQSAEFAWRRKPYQTYHTNLTAGVFMLKSETIRYTVLFNMETPSNRKKLGVVWKLQSLLRYFCSQYNRQSASSTCAIPQVSPSEWESTSEFYYAKKLVMADVNALAPPSATNGAPLRIEIVKPNE